MLKAFAVAFVIIGVGAAPGTASAASPKRDGVRKVERIDGPSARTHARRSAERAVRAPHRAADDDAWTGTRVDAAGNSYLYFRTGAGTPFGPGRVLR